MFKENLDEKLIFEQIPEGLAKHFWKRKQQGQDSLDGIIPIINEKKVNVAGLDEHLGQEVMCP